MRIAAFAIAAIAEFVFLKRSGWIESSQAAKYVAGSNILGLVICYAFFGAPVGLFLLLFSATLGGVLWLSLLPGTCRCCVHCRAASDDRHEAVDEKSVGDRPGLAHLEILRGCFDRRCRLRDNSCCCGDGDIDGCRPGTRRFLTSFFDKIRRIKPAFAYRTVSNKHAVPHQTAIVANLEV